MKRRRRFWTEEELELLRREYPGVATRNLACRLGRPVASVYNKAGALGLRKSAARMARLWRENGKRLARTGAATRFEFGHQRSPNRGVKGWDAGGRSHATRFRTGHKPHSWMPVGTERKIDGYLYRKVADTGEMRTDWRLVHHLLWKSDPAWRPPEGWVLAFKNGDVEDVRLANLELVPRSELMARNTIDQLPEELKSTIRVLAQLRRRIRKRKNHGNEEHPRRSARPSVRDDREAPRRGRSSRG